MHKFSCMSLYTGGFNIKVKPVLKHVRFTQVECVHAHMVFNYIVVMALLV